MKRSLCLLVAITIFVANCKKDKDKTLATISTTAVSDVTASSLKSGGNVTNDGNSQITQRGVCWADHANPTVADSITKDVASSGTFTSTIIGLNANTTYYIRAYAVNSSGTAYGNEVSIKTLPGLAALTTTAISDIQPLSAKGGGNVTNDGGASVIERGIVYGNSPNPTLSNFKITSGTGIGSFTATMSPLASQQTYYVRAYATNSYGTNYGNQIQFNAASANTVTDVEGNVYPYVTVCGKDWTASNLKTKKYKNGDPITNGSSISFNWGTWPSYAAAYVNPNRDGSKVDSFGLLYSMAVIKDPRGVCPANWHVATDAEWQALEVCQGMNTSVANTNDFRGTIGSKFLEGGSTGLNIRKAGYLVIIGGSNADYTDYNMVGMQLTGTQLGTSGLFYFRGFNIIGIDPIYRNYTDSWAGSVRCVKD